jgi:DNA-binding NtrC family response regulator
MDLVEHLAHIEKTIIETTLVAYNGNITKCAEYLKLNRTTLVMKIERLKITVETCIGYNSNKTDTGIKALRKPTGFKALKTEAILNALIACNYSRTKAASYLNISYRTVNAFVHDAKLDGVVVPDVIRNKRKKRNLKLPNN